MAQFQYKAMDPRGKLVTGTMEAANAADLELLGIKPAPAMPDLG